METVVTQENSHSPFHEEFMIWMKELKARNEELTLKMQETDRQMQETDRRIQETDRLMQENARRKAEYDAKYDREMKEIGRRLGELGNRFGELAEHLVAPGIMDKFNELGFHFTRVSDYTKIRDFDTKKTLAEIDIMLENKDSVVAVEVKSKPREKHIEDHIKRMEVLRYVADRNQDNRKYYGAVAGAIMSDAIRSNILQNGFYLIEQTGDTVKITIPEGFTPREW